MSDAIGDRGGADPARRSAGGAGRRPARPGFTLVQLLVSIGIVCLLVAMTLAGAGRLRETARRAEDLSNLRQLVAACTAYAGENGGYLPPGRMDWARPNEDDYTWMHYSACWKRLAGRAGAAGLPLSCAGVREGRAGGFGRPPGGFFPDDVMVGWVFWGGRDDLFDGTQVKYRSPHRLGDRLTPGSQTLWTCWCWDSNGRPSPSVCPHVGGAYVEYPPGVPVQPAPDGLGVALADGSASFVPRGELVIIPKANGFKLYYQP